MSAMVASSSIIADSETATATTPESQITCEGDHACDIDKRSPQFFGAGDPFHMNIVFDWYCNAPYEKKVPAIECGTDKLKQPLTHEVCTTMCRYVDSAPDKYECLTYAKCAGKELKKQCMCWGFDSMDKEKAKVIVGKGTPQVRSTFTSTRTGAKKTGV